MNKRTLSGFRLTAILTLAATIGATALAGSGPAWATAASQSKETTVSPLAEVARRAVEAGAPGVVVRVNTGQRRVLEFSSQTSWSRAEHTLRPTDQFRVGSNTKTMVATLVLQLVGEKKLSLTDPVEKWLPGLVPNGSAITVKMLLNHTSGLFSNTDDLDVVKAVFGLDDKLWTSKELLAAGTRHEPLFPPGEKWSYSNTNYTALGLILEKVTGQSLPTLLRRRIIQPLGLTSTYFATSSASRDGDKLAHGYEPDAQHLKALIPDLPEGFEFAGPERDGHADVTAINPNWAGAAGAVVSTTADWDHFLTALLSGELLPAAQLQQMLTTVPVDPADPAAGRYGLGIGELDTPCGTVYGHTGGIPGYRTDAFTDRTGNRSAMVFTTEQQGLAEPQLATAHQAVVTGAICAMNNKPTPGAMPR